MLVDVPWAHLVTRSLPSCEVRQRTVSDPGTDRVVIRLPLWGAAAVDLGQQRKAQHAQRGTQVRRRCPVLAAGRPRPAVGDSLGFVKWSGPI